MFRYFFVNKPYRVLSQFSPQPGKETLANYFTVPIDVYPAGRLDYDSKGLLLLTNDKTINKRLFDPRYGQQREYWVQVEGRVDSIAISKPEKGVQIHINGMPWQCKPCRVEIFSKEPDVPGRIPPIRFRKNIPITWLRLQLTEGKNRQVRRMTAATGYPPLRLIRTRIGRLSPDGLASGQMKELTRSQVVSALFTENTPEY